MYTMNMYRAKQQAKETNIKKNRIENVLSSLSKGQEISLLSMIKPERAHFCAPRGFLHAPLSILAYSFILEVIAFSSICRNKLKIREHISSL